MPSFIPGLELNRRFYQDAVRPLLDKHFPNLPHAAAHIGAGSDVLGFDTEMSTDHGWGPSVHIFLRDEDIHQSANMHEMLSQYLPHEFYGYPVNFDEAADDPGSRVMKLTNDGPVNHRVFPTTLRDFCWKYLAYDMNKPPDVADWLTFPSQLLRGMTAGAVYHDGIGELTALRSQLAWYPRDVWLYLLASGWQRIGQEEHLMPRAGLAGDEPGSAIIGSRLARDVMSLCFLMEKQYAPYPKWFGTAFKQLTCADKFLPVLWRVQLAPTWREREAALSEAYELLARMHNALRITVKVPESVTPFFTRPFKVIQGSAIAQSLIEQISDPVLMRIATRPLIGSVDQFSDSTDLREGMTYWRAAL
ncbi:MAG TPA: DUF4037 domain-containing protein, partial [Ktedonobacteraceae bacterium]|nr:DUF4037 domain-containing protein [Ktedonobacteraceae bacterium]